MAAAALVVAAPIAEATVTVTAHFEVIAAAPYIFGDEALINNGASESQTGALLFLTENISPGGACNCVIDQAPLGVMYDTFWDRWAVINEDQSAMPAGASFNVLAVPASSPGVFVHTAAAPNIDGQLTLINSPLTNDNPKAELQVTQDFDPGAIGGTYDPHVIGVWYDSALGEWSIINEDGEFMPVGASFNVMVGPTHSNGGKESVLETSHGNSPGGVTLFNGANGVTNPNVIAFTTPDVDWNNHANIFDSDPTSVGYFEIGPNAFIAGVFHDDDSPMVLHEQINTLTFSS